MTFPKLTKVFCLFYTVAILATTITAHASDAEQSSALTSAGVYKTSPESQTQLLERASNAVLWVSQLGRQREDALQPSEVREKLTPLEAMQAALLLDATITKLQNAERKTPEIPDEIKRAEGAIITIFGLAKRMEITPEEAFEIVECRFAPDDIDRVAKLGAATEFLETLRNRAATFLKDELNAAEKTVLTTEGDVHAASPLATMKAAGVLANVGHPALVYWLLRRFNATDPSDAECAEIVNAVGIRTLTSLLHDARFTPENAKAIETLTTRASRFFKGRDGIEAALNKLTSRDSAERREAEKIVWRGGKVSVSVLLNTLATASDDDAKSIAATLKPMGRTVRGALVELLLNANEPIAVERAATLLAQSQQSNELLPLLAVVYDTRRDAGLRDRIAAIVRERWKTVAPKSDVVASLLQRARDYIERATPLKTDADGKAVFWNWSDDADGNAAGDGTAGVVSVALPVDLAYRLFAFHYANLALAIEPENREVRQLFVIAFLERGAYLVGRDESAEAVDAALLSLVEPPLLASELEAALLEAVNLRQLAAATRIANILGEHATFGDIARSANTSNGDAAVLVQMVRYPDPRLRFAALEAVVHILLASDDSNRPFAGSSWVVDALCWFARGDGNNTFLSIAPKQSDATAIGEAMQSQGYDVVAATTCREGLSRLIESPDVTLVAIDARCVAPSVRDLLLQCEGREIPVAVYTHDERLWSRETEPLTTQTRWERRQSQTRSQGVWSSPMAVVFPTPTNSDAVRTMIANLIEQTGVDPIPEPIRLEQARESLVWLTELLKRQRESGVSIFNHDGIAAVVEYATQSPYTLRQGIELATELDGVAVQIRLADLAMASMLSDSLREFAASAFKTHVERFGVLLRGQQITRIYDAYNASETESPEVQKILGSLLDVIERKKK
ncbi:MAG: hypothetical protein ACRC46_14995 [Thermoguttaceae bacterium]